MSKAGPLQGPAQPRAARGLEVWFAPLLNDYASALPLTEPSPLPPWPHPQLDK